MPMTTETDTGLKVESCRASKVKELKLSNT